MTALRSARTPLPAAIAALLLAAACGGDDGGGAIDGDAAAGLEIPAGDELQAWLADGSYQEFPAESAAHSSTGPHGSVRTFLSPGLEASMAAGGEHPRGVGAVKELFDDDALAGWAVSVKVADDSAGGDGWYWFEVTDTSPDATPVTDGTGIGICTGCHSAGRDFVQVPFPLE